MYLEEWRVKSVMGTETKAVACKTCGNIKCGNHAACARRKATQRNWEHVLVWNVVWLYVGAYRFVRAMEEIENDDIRNFVVDSFLDDMPKPYVKFLAFATSPDQECREHSWRIARELLPGLPELYADQDLVYYTTLRPVPG